MVSLGDIEVCFPSVFFVAVDVYLVKIIELVVHLVPDIPLRGVCGYGVSVHQLSDVISH